MFWTKANCTHKHIHDHYEQITHLTCGVSCCAMAIANLKGDKLTENTILMAVNQRGMPPMLGCKDTDIEKVLRHYKIAATTHRGLSADGLKTQVRSATATRPVIVAVIWEGKSYGHWVIVVNRTKNGRGSSSDYCILDPEDGLVVTSLTPGTMSIGTGGSIAHNGLLYTSAKGAKGVLKGTAIKVTGLLR